MNLRRVEIFAKVCEIGGVTKAAEELSLAQPAVSQAIKEMEDYYGLPLFDRVGRRIELTETGKCALDYAKRILSLADEADETIQDKDKNGPVRVGSSVTIGTCLLPDLAKAFSLANPKAGLRVRIDDSLSLEKMVASNELDFALIEGPLSVSGLIETPFLRDDLAFVGKTGGLLGEKTEIPLEKVASLPLLLREKGSGTRQLFESALFAKGVAVAPVWESISTEALIEAVKENLGVSALPRRLVAKELADGSLTEYGIKGIKLERRFSLIRREGKRLSEADMAFIKLVPGLGDYHR
jgi:DNA-binding transcriptional LysR family regulator